AGIDAIDYERARITFREGLIEEIITEQTVESMNATRQGFQSFIQWASRERIYELVELMRGIEFVFAKENATAWLALLQEWRVATFRPARAYYKIDCRIDPSTGRLEGTETIRLTNGGSEPVERLALDWTLSSTESIEVSIGGQRIQILGESEQRFLESPIFFELPEPLDSSEQIELHVRFTRTHSTERSQIKFRLTGWHPRLFWGFPTHDDFDVRIDAPDDYAIATSGRLDSQSGYHHAENVRSFGLFLGKDMQVLESEVGGILIRCPYNSESRECAELLVETAEDVIAFYRDRFGFYPSTSLTIIPGMDYPAGGYRAATNLVEIHGQERMRQRSELHWRWIAAHEIGHQYWGEYVLDKSLQGWNWLMVGLGTYADREYTRTAGLSLDKHRNIVARYTNGVRRFYDTRAEQTPTEIADMEFDFNNVVTHGKGFSIISALASLLGHDTFDRIYLRCLSEFAGDRMGVREFRAVCEDEVQKDLGWFFDQWVYSSRYLSYEIISRECSMVGDTYVSVVQIECLGTLRMPIPVVANFEDGTSATKTTDRFLDIDVLHFESAAPLSDVRLDPDGELALVVPPPTVDGAILGRALDQMEYIDIGQIALDLYLKALEIELAEGSLWKKLGVALYDGKYYEEAVVAFRRSTELLENEGSPYTFVAYVWQGHVLDILGRREQAILSYEEALRRDTGRTSEYSQYNMKIDQQWIRERLDEPFRRE
ncbi:MAG: hypothetical protein KAT85_11870, partial [candidate division Zixibacteria bacterium]|nr:hypothetical protein [candidate division Zixibacteria bacterium]